MARADQTEKEQFLAVMHEIFHRGCASAPPSSRPYAY